jgi:ABC-type xylose transport system permease subunit
MAFFQIVTDGTLLRAVNVTNLLLQNSYIVIMALGMLVVIVSGNIDLSVGSVMGFIGALAAVMIVNYDSRSMSRSRSASSWVAISARLRATGSPTGRSRPSS